MQMRVYTIYDQKAETFGLPFYQQTHGLAERSFRELVLDEKSKVNKYPEDFDLYYLGLYDDQTGKFDALASPEHVLKAIQVANYQDSKGQLAHLQN